MGICRKAEMGRLRKFGYQPRIAVFKATSYFRFGQPGTFNLTFSRTFDHPLRPQTTVLRSRSFDRRSANLGQP